MIVYHYCSVDTFMKILDSKVLWLSNLTDSNDKEEVSRTFKNLWQTVSLGLRSSDLDKSIVEQQIELLNQQFEIEVKCDPPYGCCFCVEGDLLEQWKEYGDKTRGVALGFDIDWFSDIQKEMPHPNTSMTKSIGFERVIYHNREHDEAFYRICYDAIRNYGLHAWMMAIRPTWKHYSAFVKNPKFIGEIETRIVYYPDSNHDYAANPYGLYGPIENPSRHYCLPWIRESSNHSLRKIGLGCNCSLDMSSIQKSLSDAGVLGDIQLYLSECSYRIRS